MVIKACKAINAIGFLISNFADNLRGIVRELNVWKFSFNEVLKEE
jgi:hypothetical protein